MLSRRNIRIKVMQVLYAMSRDKELSHRQASLLYNDNIRHSFELYLLSLLQLMRVAHYAQQDYAAKQARLRPTDEDKAFLPKLAQNEALKSLEENKGLKSLFTIHKMEERVTEDNTRLLYNEFAKTDAYKEYLKKADTKAEDHRLILLDLYKTLTASETFNDLLEDNYLSWQDDKSLVIGAMKKTLKALPVNGSFYQEFEPTDETVREFGEMLLKQVYENDAELLEHIEPVLKNWDAERVAVLDMVLLKMALAELMNFPTIPTKVTLNEFVEISKTYSTDKSKDFINGILDRLMKKLHKEGKIVKEGRGLIED
ncbi:MAG: transcription antitermination factor NusB [Bacteroidota bacterium]